MRMTSTGGKRVAGYFVDYNTSSKTYVHNAVTSFFQASKYKQAEEYARKLLTTAKDSGASSATATIYVIYRDDSSGRFLPGRDVVHKTLSVKFK